MSVLKELFDFSFYLHMVLGVQNQKMIVKILLKDWNIEITNIVPAREFIRKSGLRTVQYIFSLSRNLQSLISLYGKIGY